MSAWLCSEDHINCIVNAVGGDKAAFDMLVAENLRSLEARYPGRDFLQEWKDQAKTYRFKKAPPADMTQVVKCCDSYGYQACETDDYAETKAAAYISVVHRAAVECGGAIEGPEYDRAEWSL